MTLLNFYLIISTLWCQSMWQKWPSIVCNISLGPINASFVKHVTISGAFSCQKDWLYTNNWNYIVCHEEAFRICAFSEQVSVSVWMSLNELNNCLCEHDWGGNQTTDPLWSCFPQEILSVHVSDCHCYDLRDWLDHQDWRMWALLRCIDCGMV